MDRENIIVIGTGQSLRGDDAAGLEAVRRWQADFPVTAGRVRVELCELPGLGLLDLLEGMQAAIIVDAVHTAAVPGSLYRLEPQDLDAFTTGTGSAHGWGVAETLAMGRSLYPELAKCRITLIGIVGGQFEMGAGLSPTVQAALEQAARMIEKEVQSQLSR
jgi:hydrogenase maturation protease